MGTPRRAPRFCESSLVSRPAAALCVGILLAASSRAQAPETYIARLTMMPIEVATRANVTGAGTGSATLDGRRLTVSGSFSGLQGRATAARIHEGAALGIRGTAVYDLTVAATIEGTFSGEFELGTEQLESLREGRLYIQIDSEAAPEGNLWGWLLRKPI